MKQYLKENMTSRKASLYSILTVVLLYPGFFLYHTAVGMGVFYPYLGGYFGFVSLLLAPFVLFFFHKKIKFREIKFNKFDYVFFAIAALNLGISFFEYFFGDVINNFEMLSWSLSGLYFNILMYCTAKNLDLNDVNQILYSRVLIFCLIIISCLVFLNADNGEFGFERGINDVLISYQGYGRSLVVMGFFLNALIRSSKANLVIFSLIVVLLYLNGARTEFVLYMVAIISLLIARKKIHMGAKLYMFVLLLLFFYFVYDFLVEIIRYLPETRMLEIIFMDSNTSAEARNHLNIVAWGTIKDNPIFGDYGSYIFNEGDIGAFSHTILSAWVNLGLIGFLMYIYIVLYMLHQSYKGIRKEVCTSKDKLFYLFSIYIFFAFLTSKDYTYFLFGFAVGFSSLSKSKAKH